MKSIFPYKGLLLLLCISCNTDIEELSPAPDPVDPEPVASMMQVVIQTNGNQIVDEPKVMANMQIITGDTIAYNGPIGIEYRGSSSQYFFDKKSFGFETWDENGEDVDVALVGFPEEEDWIFYGPFSDKTLLRNVFIYSLSNEIGRYASKTKFCEITLNGNYEGVYVLMEKIKRDKNRVAISKLKSDDITGGYMLKIDKATGDGTGGQYTSSISFPSQFDGNGDPEGTPKVHFLYDYPDAEDIEPEEKAYIQAYIHGFENALKSADFTDPNTGYLSFIDRDSFIDFFLLNELSNNPDGYRISTYMYKDKGGKLQMGPIWDFNIAFGNVDYCNAWETDHWAYRFKDYCPGGEWQVPFWWERLMEDPAFVSALKARWTSLRQGPFSASFIDQLLQSKRAYLEDTGALGRNYDRWQVLGTYIWPNYYIGQHYGEEYVYFRQWISARLAWMDGAIADL
ncbi:MAG: CotH kinase family protein [Lutibacter sp.]|jgi:hypothetical protein|nr:CotH kinase family protein [Lutibacter sp.]